MSTRAARTYRRMDVKSAPKTQVLDLLLGRLLTDMDSIRSAIRDGNAARKQAEVDHALRILTELTAALDRNAAPSLCDNLESLYDFAAHRLLEAGRTLNPALVGAAEDVIRDLRGAFAEAARAAS